MYSVTNEAVGKDADCLKLFQYERMRDKYIRRSKKTMKKLYRGWSFGKISRRSEQSCTN